jgi:peptide/nickel transport system substrate-binding protein
MVSLTARTDPLFGVDRSFLCNTTNVPYVNPTGYCNPDLDAIAAKAAAVPLEERRQWYKQYEEIIARDMPHLTLTNAKKFFAISSRFGGIDEEMDLAFNGNPDMASVWVK